MSGSGLRRRLDPEERYGLRLTLLAVAVVLVAVPFAWLLHQVVVEGPLVRLDTDVAEALHRWVRSRPVMVDGLQVVSFLGKPIWLVVVCGIATVHLLWRRRHRLAVFLVVTTAAGGLIDTAVKTLVARPRPELDDPLATASGHSFPSGHSMSATVAYVALLLIYLPAVSRGRRPGLVAGCAVLVAAVAFSRLALGLHYVTDVTAGIVLGLAWVTASAAAFETWRVDRGRHRTEPLEEGLEPEEVGASGR